MFAVVPPPSRAINPAGSNFPGITTLETHNTIAHPSGFDLLVGEGTYVLRDDLHLATPPPHPNDVAPPNNNPLASISTPPTTGVKLNVVVFASSKEPDHGLFKTHSSRTQIASIQEEVTSPKSDNGSMSNGFGSAGYYSALPSFGDSNPALAPVVVKGKKKEDKVKPKNNMVKSNSSFVSRVISNDTMTKRLNERSPEGLLVFANVNRAYLMMDLSSENKTDNLSKVLFTKAHVLCHDVNSLTRTTTHLDIVMGFNTGDIIWYEPMSQKYARINKSGLINSTPVIDVHWLPRKEGLFLAVHTDGTIAVYDKEKEDAELIVEGSVEGTPTTEGDVNDRLEILKSVKSQNQKNNPVAAWRFNKSKTNACTFSPDGQHLALVSDDGTLTVFDYINETILDVYRSFYGALLVVTWSPDGQYILTGGQDDLISIWSFAEQALVARCVGHESWVRDIKFDAWRCDERNYRFGSVGEDCRLLLWDFSVGMLGRPKAMSVRNRGSLSSVPAAGRKESIVSTGRLRSNSNLTQFQEEQKDGVHAVEPKAAVATLPPVLSKIIDDTPIRWLGFTEGSIITSSDGGE